MRKEYWERRTSKDAADEGVGEDQMSHDKDLEGKQMTILTYEGHPSTYCPSSSFPATRKVCSLCGA